jgi:O-antigen/teichoic acid export membrane protein
MTANLATDSTLSSPTSPPSPFRVSRGQIAKSVFSNWSGLVVNVLVAFWMIPFVVHHLGNAAYGIWALVLQLTGYLGVVDTGLRSAIVRFVARYHAQNDDASLSRLLNGMITLYAMFAPFCMIVGTLLAAFVLPRMHIPPEIMTKAQITTLLAAGVLATDFIFAAFHAGLAGLSRWDLTNGVGIFVILLRTALIVVFLELGFGLVTLAILQLATTLLAYAIEIVLLRGVLPSYRFRLERPRRAAFQPIIEHSWYSFLLSLANRLNYQVDSIVIAAFLPIDQVTFYVIGLRLVEYLRDLLNSTTLIIAPLVSSLDAVGQTKQVESMLIRGTKYSLLVGFLGIAVLLGLGTDFIRLWMGPRFAGPSGSVLVILAIGQLVSMTQFASGHVLFGLSKHRLNLIWTFVEAFLNLSLSIGLVRYYGILGVAAGTTIANALVRGWFFPRAFLRFLGVHWREYVRHGVAPAAAPAAAFLIATLVFKRFFAVKSYGALLLLGGLALAVCLPFLWVFGLDKADRKFLWSKGRQFILGTGEIAIE